MNKSERNQILRELDMADILENLHDGLGICDASGKMLYVTENYEKMFGARAEEVIGKNNSEIEMAKPAISDLVLEEGKRVVTKQENRFGDEFFVTGMPIRNETGKIEYVVTYNSLEITTIHELEENYRKLQQNTRRILQTVNQVKNEELHTYYELIIKSRAMKTIAGLIRRFAAADIPVLFEGEKGCGKTFLAQYMHSISPRKDSIFYIWDPKEESGSVQEVLFGSKEQIGMIEMCRGGTLVIKNVEKLSFAVQGKLKRYLEKPENKADETEDDSISCNETRIIFTSSRPLTELLTNNLISSELYYAMGTATVSIPPIRQRPEDLSACIDYYLSVFNRKYNKEVALSERAKGMLLSYDWPENIREVRFLMERTVLMNDSKLLGVYELPEVIVNRVYNMENEKTDLNAMLDFYEGQIILRAYQRCGSSIAVAKELGISQSSAFRKLKKYVPDYREVPAGRRKKQS